MSLSAGLLRISRTALRPVRPGIITSRTARSGWESRQASTAELPSATVTISCPRVASLNSTRSRMSTSSSATTINATWRPFPTAVLTRVSNSDAIRGEEPAKSTNPASRGHPWPPSVLDRRRLLLHLLEELVVGLRLAQPPQQQLRCLRAVQPRKGLTQLPHD